jgi:hypothetical protein
MDLNLFLSGLPKSKGPGRRPPLALELLEDRITPSTMHLGVGRVLHGLNLGAALARLESVAHGHAHPIQQLRTMAHDAIQTLTTLSHDLTSAAGQLGSATGLTPDQLTTLLTGVQNSLSTAASALTSNAGMPSGLVHKLGQPGRLLSSSLSDLGGSLTTALDTVRTIAGQVSSLSGIAPSSLTGPLGTLLTDLANTATTVSNSLSGLAGSTTPTAGRLFNAVVGDVTGSLSNVAGSLNALTGILSGAAGSTTDSTMALLNGVVQDVASNLGSVQNSLNALAGILPAVTDMTLSNARQVLSSALANATTDVGAISGDLALLKR